MGEKNLRISLFLREEDERRKLPKATEKDGFDRSYGKERVIFKS